MNTTETINPPKGYFKCELIKDDKVIDTIEDYNLIMDRARYNIATGISGFSGGTPITKIVFGTSGNEVGNLTVPKTAADGFVSSRTSLFSEANGSYTYTINFVPTTSGSYATVTETDINSGSLVTVTYTNTSITYVVEMSQTAGNNGSSVNYTEAAFYCGTNIFSMKCFPVRVKDNSVKIKITWSFTF